jgi:phosphoribosylanthranilate isomerase
LNTKIKICGITTEDDAIQIALLGVDALGFVFAKSPRQIDLEKARKIISKLPSFVSTVGVFVNQPVEFMKKTVEYSGIDYAQLHGDEGVDVCLEMFPRVIKVARIRDNEDVEKLIPYKDVVRAFLLDAFSQKLYGGTGEAFDWSIAKYAINLLDKPVILAGGITPDNCMIAVNEVKPFGIDVSSGVEICPGQKDISKVRDLLKKIRG